MRYSYPVFAVFIVIIALFFVVIVVLGPSDYPSESGDQYHIIVSKMDPQTSQHKRRIKHLSATSSSQSRSVLEIEPVSLLGQYHGVFSLDLSSSDGIVVGSTIDLQLPDEKLQLKVVDVYPDENRWVYEFLGEEGANSLLVYFPQSGRAYVRLETKTMLFETDLDTNGVGYFYNLKEAAIDGVAASYKDDEIVPLMFNQG